MWIWWRIPDTSSTRRCLGLHQVLLKHQSSQTQQPIREQIQVSWRHWWRPQTAGVSALRLKLSRSYRCLTCEEEEETQDRQEVMQRVCPDVLRDSCDGASRTSAAQLDSSDPGGDQTSDDQSHLCCKITTWRKTNQIKSQLNGKKIK